MVSGNLYSQCGCLQFLSNDRCSKRSFEYQHPSRTWIADILKPSETYRNNLKLHMIQVWHNLKYSETYWNLLNHHMMQLWNFLKYSETIWNTPTHSETAYDTMLTLSETVWIFLKHVRTISQSSEPIRKLFELCLKQLWYLMQPFQMNCKDFGTLVIYMLNILRKVQNTSNIQRNFRQISEKQIHWSLSLIYK